MRTLFIPFFRLPAGLAALGLALTLSLTGCSKATPQSLVDSGKQLAQKKDYKGAVIQYKAALAADPNSAEAHFQLGKALLGADDPAGAVIALNKALDGQYPPERVVPTLAQALLAMGDFKKVANSYGDTTLIDKTAMASLKSSVALAWGGLGEKVKSAAALQAALAAEPDFAPARLLEARLMASQGAFTEALAQVDRILARDPSLHETWMLKGEVQRALKDEAGADASFRKTLEIQADYLPAHMALITRLVDRGDMAGAQEQLSRLKAVRPGHPVTTYAEALMAFSAGDLRKARELAQQLIRIAPDDVNALALSGAVEGRLGSLGLAEANFAKALQINPEVATVRLNLGQVYLRLGQPAKALSTLQPLLSGPAESAQGHALAGEAEQGLGRAGAAELHFKRATAMDPANDRFAVAAMLSDAARNDPGKMFAELQSLSTKSKDAYADQMIVSARMLRGEYDAALAAVDVMARKQPDSAPVYELRGRIEKARGDTQAARSAYEQALKRDPTLYAATASLAAMDVMEQKPEVARARLEASINADPQNYYARIALAALQRRSGAKLDEVKATLMDAVKTSPGASLPRLMLMDLMLNQRQNKEALSLASDAIAALPSDASVLEAAGLTQMKAGDAEQAIKSFRKLTNLQPTAATPWVRLAEIYRAQGNSDAAENALKKALEIAPGFKAAQTALTDLLVVGKRSGAALDFAMAQQQRTPKDASGYLFEGLTHLRLNAPEAAIAAYRKGLTAIGNSSELAVALYTAQVNVGKLADAERFAASWLKDHPNDYAFDFQVSVSQLERGDYAQAEARLARIVTVLPDNAIASNNLAWVLTRQGKPGGVAFAQRAVNAVPDRSELLDTLAMTLALDKQFPKAMQTQQRAIELAPGNPVYRLGLARIAMQSGDKTLARKELQALKAMGSTFTQQDEVTKLLGAL